MTARNKVTIKNGRRFGGTLLEEFHGLLTAALPLAGTRQLGDGQTTQELRVESAFATALRVPLYDTYRWPLRDGLTAVPELDRDALTDWIRGEFATPAGRARTGRLADTLEQYFIQAFNLSKSPARTQQRRRTHCWRWLTLLTLANP